jgi:hypothetical protein
LAYVVHRVQRAVGKTTSSPQLTGLSIEEYDLVKKSKLPSSSHLTDDGRSKSTELSTDQPCDMGY